MSLSQEEVVALAAESTREARREVQFAGGMLILLGVVAVLGFCYARLKGWF